MLPSIELARLEALHNADIEDQRQILLARRYHEGDQDVYLNERALEFLGLHDENKFRMNVCQVVVNAVLDELEVVGFDTGEEGEQKPIAEWAAKTWEANRMDAIQRDVHLSALRDRESFVIVDWNDDEKRPVYTWHQRYTSLEAAIAGKDGGDEQGCYMLYPFDDYTQRPLVAVQRWVEELYEKGKATQRQRMTVYYPNRIERFFYDGGWKRYTPENKTVWPEWWTDNGKQDGRPLGLPVIHFRNADLRPEAWDAIPMQDAVNKFMVDIVAMADQCGFPINFASGFYPTTDGKQLKDDGSNAAQMAPNQLIGTTKADANFKRIPGESPQPLVETLTTLIQYTAFITSTPPSRFTASSQVTSGDSQRELNKPLTKKADNRKTLFGNAWEDVLGVARRLENAFGKGGIDEAVPLSTIWKRTFSPEELTAKKALGVPQEQIWREMGYSERQITAMKNMDEYKMKNEAQRASLDAQKRLQGAISG